MDLQKQKSFQSQDDYLQSLQLFRPLYSDSRSIYDIRDNNQQNSINLNNLIGNQNQEQDQQQPFLNMTKLESNLSDFKLYNTNLIKQSNQSQEQMSPEQNLLQQQQYLINEYIVKPLQRKYSENQNQQQNSLQLPNSLLQFQAMNSFELKFKQESQQLMSLKIKQESDLFSISKVEQKNKVNKKIKKKYYDKNICVNIIKKSIMCLVHQSYKKEVLDFCEQNEDLYYDVISYFYKQKELISGFQSLKGFITLDDNNDEINQYNRKVVFIKFLKWFLRDRYIRYILEGKMKNKNKYIQYKNLIMIRMIDKPQKWISNQILQK